jgi:hypothetical protein
MKEYTSIEKDTILRCFYLGVSINYQSCQDIINILVSDGYVVLRTSVNGRAYHITDKGKGFILQGGYAKQDNERKQEKIEKWKTSTINWIMALVIAIASSIITLIVTKLLS